MGRTRRITLVLAGLLAVLVIALFWLSRPPQLAGLVLGRAGAALGLEIGFSGEARYRLRGVPMLEVRQLVVREPGQADPLLTAERAYLALPWDTLRGRGTALEVQRIELDAPRLDLPALRHWLAGRPPSEGLELPVLADGLAIQDGVVAGIGWQFERLDLDSPRVHPDEPAAVTASGRYLDAPLQADFDLDLDLPPLQPLLDGHGGPAAARGTVRVERDGLSLPIALVASGPLRWRDGIAAEPLRLGAFARYRTDGVDLPLTLGLLGPLRFETSRLSVAPDALLLRPAGADSPIPTLDARGQAMLDASARATAPLDLALHGTLAAWPDAWPALPPPVGQSDAPLPFALRYAGPLDASGPARLMLARDDTRFDARFRLPRVLAWVDALATGTPLPPLDGRLQTPRMIVAGATLEGVVIEFEDDAE
ncbi:hypothetical protein H4F99_13330 [Lysobacter sp. SG-8]|uniref:AsmA family protein n=1 Tax=Marilutibacter penaei TaxID=2759900 RepID=A0A7W3YFN3_9GAMM|nr:hypothetical protein [Lysobacter penaei]MBB1089461.1 hypothetical protein [Lysobacter penaei]